MNCSINGRGGCFLPLLGLLAMLLGCGGSSTSFSNVAVTVSPSSANTTTGQQVTLQATVTGLSGSTPALSWTIQELQTGGASGAQCNWLGSTPPAGPCPDGTIQGADTQPNTKVTYNAPGSQGTFHVQVQWSSAFTPVVTKTATATITVN